MQREIGHLAIKVVHRRFGIGDGDLAGRGFAGYLGKDTVTLFLYGKNVTGGFVIVTEHITGAVVKVADVGIVHHRGVTYYHGVFRLYDVEFREVGAHLVIAFLLHVACEPDCADEGTGVGRVAVGVDTSHRHEFI